MVQSTKISPRKVQQRTRTRAIAAVFSITGLAIATVFVAVASLFWGAYELSVTDTLRLILSELGFVDAAAPPAVSYLLWHIRLPRILLALAVGGTLAVSGASLQALFRNPLADPGLVGVTSGAMMFTVAGIVLSSQLTLAMSAYVNYFTLTILGFLGSLLTTWIVYRLATFGNKTYVATMLLAGVAIGALAAAVTGLFTYFSNEEQLRDITFWTLGSLASANWNSLSVVLPIAIIVMLILMRQTRAMNLFLLGEQEAAFAGVNVQRTKHIIVVCTALGVGACVVLCGMIGFVGLVVPHLLRLTRGTDHRWLLPASALLGGALLVLADSVARTAIAPAELPIGVLTALIGSPFFLWLLLRSRGRMAIQF